jgi:O-antigen ligase
MAFYLDKLWFLILYSLMYFPILPRGLESTLMIAFSIISIILWIQKNKTVKKIDIKISDKILIFLYCSPFVFFVLSLLYSANLAEGLKSVVRVLPLILFPILFGYLRRGLISKKILNQLISNYVFALVIGLLLLNIVFFEELYFLDKTNWQIRQLIEEASDVHGTYMSLWVGFGILILINKMSSIFILANLKRNALYISIICYFIYWQITIGARMPFAITMFLAIGYFIINVELKLSIVIGILSLLVSIMFLFLSKSNLAVRLQSTISVEHSFPVGDYAKEYKNISAEDIRKGVYFCSWILVKEAPFAGLGIGDVQDQLDRCYNENMNSNVYQMFKYNSHNQYFQILLSAGITALVCFVLSLLMPIYLAYKRKDYLWFLFTLLIMICFLTENVINRHDGVIFYGLFSAILTFNNLKIK